MKGIPDPLRQFPDFHALLDAVEPMILESYQKDVERDMYFQKNYRPEIDEIDTSATREDEESSFDAFLAAVNASGIT